MPRRGENIRKRKDNRWEGRYISEYDASGKAKYISVYGKTYLEVKNKMFEARNLNKKAHSVIKEKILFQEVLFLWLENKKSDFKEQTYLRYQYIIDTHIIPLLGEIEIQKVTIETINDFVSTKLSNGRLDGNGGLSVSYTQTMLFIIVSAINFATNEKFCFPLTSRPQKLTKPKKYIEVLTVLEQKKLESYLYEALDVRKASILLALYTGIRVGELCGLKWEDIDFINGILHIRHTIERISNNSNVGAKTKLIISDVKTASSERLIPLSQNSLNLLYKLKSENREFVLPGLSHPFLEPRTLQYSFKKYIKESDIRNFKFHALRHSFATRCMESGMDMKTLSEILGHSNVNITMNIYVHSTIEHKKEKIEAMSLYCGQK